MTRNASLKSPLLLGVVVVTGHWLAALAYAADGIPAATGRSGLRPRQSIAQSELRLVEPKPLSARGRAYPVAQPGPVPPGSNVGEAPARDEMPPVQTLPPTMREAQEIDPSWKPIGAVTVAITNPAGDVPDDLAVSRFAAAGVLYAPAVETRNWMEYSYFWQASGSRSGPLYFEEPNLERYGYKFGCLQPAVSAAHFFATIPLLPYKVVVHPPHECVYSLGYYRPGSCAPLQHERIHFQADAAAAEAGVVIGMILLLN
jgi:hypothetical protein